MKKIIFLSLLLGNVLLLKAQEDLSIAETIKFINSNLKISDQDYKSSKDSIEITDNGEFIIHNYVYYNMNMIGGGYLCSPHTMNIAQLKNVKFKNNTTNNCGCDNPNGSNFTSATFSAVFKQWETADCKSNIKKSYLGIKNEITICCFENDYELCQSLCTAFKNLFRKIHSDPNIQAKNNLQNSSTSKPKQSQNGFKKSENGSEQIQMTKTSGGTFEVPVIINGVLKINFIYDTGASDVSISPDVALTLIRTGTVKESDFIGTQKYYFADGSSAISHVFYIKEIQIGKHKIYNVKASISNSIEAPMLLGQSVMERFGKITVDNKNHTLTIEK